MRIAFVAPPFAGHLNPMVPLASAARAHGHQVEFVTGERKRPLLEAAGFPTRALRGSTAGRLEAIAEGDRAVGSHPLRLLAQARRSLAVLPEIRDELLAAWRARRPDMVVADSVAIVAGRVATDLAIPWVTTIATPFALENRRGVPSYCGGWRPRAGVAAAWRDAAGRALVRGFKRGVGWLLRRELRRIGISGVHRADGSEAAYSPLAILGFGLNELEFARDWPRAFRMIGPVIEAPEACPSLRFPAGRRVLVTFGTHLEWAKADLVERATRVAAELARPEVEIVVSLGRPAQAGAPVTRVAPGLSVCPFVPYARDLPAFDAVVHHGGAGITYAAILHRKPSLVVPHDYDQFDFAARVAHHGLGLRARRFSASGLARLLDRPAWPALEPMAAAAARYRPAESFMETVAAVERAAR